MFLMGLDSQNLVASIVDNVSSPHIDGPMIIRPRVLAPSCIG
jgi:hypothetical protein